MHHNATENTLTREVPTHLFQFKEKVFGFFTIPQLLYDTVAFVGMWYLFNRPLPFGLRIGISVVYAIAVLIVVHIPIKGRPVTEWMFLYLRFAVTPRSTLWRPSEVVTLSKTEQAGSIPQSVQDTWCPLLSVDDNVMGFAHKKASKGKDREPDRFCTVLEVGGMNLNVISNEERVRIFSGYESFLSGLQFGLQTYSCNEQIDVQTYAPIVAQQQHLARLNKTPKLQSLAQKSLLFQRKKIGTCMATRHFVIVSATVGEMTVQTTDGKQPSMLAVLLTFAWMRRKTRRHLSDVLQELAIRTEVVQSGLTSLGLSVEVLQDAQLAQYYAASLCPGSLVLPFTQLEYSSPLHYQAQIKAA